jgi:hypothetical protein
MYHRDTKLDVAQGAFLHEKSKIARIDTLSATGLQKRANSEATFAIFPRI